jgi:anti-sigma B factor antagonist
LGKRVLDVSRAKMSSNQLEIRDENDGALRILALEGELDIATSTELDGRLESIVDSSSEDLMVDLSGVRFMDSMGLQVLLRARRKLGRQDRQLALVCPPGPILRLLVVTNLDTAFSVHPDRSAAERSLEQ